MRALVLSGGGLFGAWQAGAWSVLASRMAPDLIIGASVGSINGYAIAAGATPERLFELWRNPSRGSLRRLHRNLRELTQHPLRRPFALVVTDMLRLRPRIYKDGQITWQHLAASCAIPGVLPQMKLDGRWCGDGGLLNALPVWAAVELGATEIVGLHVMKQFPARWFRPFWHGFRWVCGYFPPIPENVQVLTLSPSCELGTLNDAIQWREDNVERWIQQGIQDTQSALGLDATPEKPFPF